MGDFWAAVAVGCGLAVGVDLDSLELLRNPCSWRHTEGTQPTPVSRQTAGNRCTGSVGGAAVGGVHMAALTVILAEGEDDVAQVALVILVISKSRKGSVSSTSSSHSFLMRL